MRHTEPLRLPTPGNSKIPPTGKLGGDSRDMVLIRAKHNRGGRFRRPLYFCSRPNYFRPDPTAVSLDFAHGPDIVLLFLLSQVTKNNPKNDPKTTQKTSVIFFAPQRRIFAPQRRILLHKGGFALRHTEGFAFGPQRLICVAPHGRICVRATKIDLRCATEIVDCATEIRTPYFFFSRRFRKRGIFQVGGTGGFGSLSLGPTAPPATRCKAEALASQP